RRVLQQVLGRRIDAIFQTNFGGIRLAGEGCGSALGERPIGVRDLFCPSRGGRSTRQSGFRRVESKWNLVGQPNISSRAKIDGVRIRRKVDEALYHWSGDGRSVGIVCNRDRNGLGVGTRKEVALPSADHTDLTVV